MSSDNKPCGCQGGPLRHRCLRHAAAHYRRRTRDLYRTLEALILWQKNMGGFDARIWRKAERQARISNLTD